MRTRLLVVLVAFALAAVAGFALPLLGSVAEQRTQRLVIDRGADIDQFAVMARQAVESGDDTAFGAAAQRYFELYGEPVLAVDAHFRTLASAGGMSTTDPSVRALVEATMRNQASPQPATIRPWSAEPAWFVRPVGTSTRVSGAVLLRASVTEAAADVTQSWVIIGVGALAAGLAFLLLAMLVARWVLRPLHELEGGVLAVGSGRRADLPARTGPRELRALASSFNQMSDAVLAAAQQQRQLIADTAHQLRNPLAALRLRVDSLAAQVSEDGQRTYQAAVVEVERLEALLDGLLSLAVADSTATRLAVTEQPDEPADVFVVVAERIDAWRPVAERAGVTLSAPRDAVSLLLRCLESELAQTLDVLLANAVNYAGAGSTVSVRWWPAEATPAEEAWFAGKDTPAKENRFGAEPLATGGSIGVLEVADDGPGLTGEERAKATERFWRANRADSPPGTGLGLAIVHSQVSVRGGTVRLLETDPHGLTVRVELPLASSGTGSSSIGSSSTGLP